LLSIIECRHPRLLAVLAGVALAAVPLRARAWIYPEHRDITAAAIKDLSAERRRIIDEMWSAARSGDQRYCDTDVYGDGTTTIPSCIDLAAWPALAADHSCSPNQFLSTVPSSDWIMRVAAIGAETKVALRKARGREERFNQWAISNLKLQVADHQYTSRATVNKAHFMVTRDSNDFGEYLTRVLAPDTEPNAIGNYVYYHMAALAMARGWPLINASARTELARDLLSTEAFALHFLEDSFAAGHVAGTWGHIAERKGTHDYYSEFGLDETLWNQSRSTILGDAHMRAIDLQRTSAAVAQSLAQVADAASNPDSPAARVGATVPPAVVSQAVSIDSCTAKKQPSATVVRGAEPLVGPIVAETPIPGLGEGDVHVPRFRQEIGPFLGFSGDLSGGSSFNGFEASAAPRAFGASNVGFRFGAGLEALTGSGGSSQAFVGLGLQYETSQLDAGSSYYNTAGVPAVPARRGVSVRLRVPFYLFPFDLLLVAPLLSWADPSTMTNMAIVAASGGRLRLHRAILTNIGSFQLLLGSEVGVALYGYFGAPIENTALAAPGAFVPYPSAATFISYRSPQFDIPVFEYRPLRTFATQQALTFALQLGFGFEVPNHVEYVSKLTLPAATGPVPELGTSWLVYLRVHFDARYYF
jgi:hypothetical protein